MENPSNLNQFLKVEINSTDVKYNQIELNNFNLNKNTENINILNMNKINKLQNIEINHHFLENTTSESKGKHTNFFKNIELNLNNDHVSCDEIEDYNHKNSNNFSTKNFNFTEKRIIFPLLGRKIFRIKKYTKYNKYLNEICTDSDITEEEKNKLKDPQVKKISPFSKVNFSKLKVEEKDERLKNLAKLVKRLRRKVRNLENKVRFNASKLLNKYVWTKLGINTKNKYVPPEFNFDFEKICRALKRVRNHEEFEFSDQKHLIENIINLIAEDKLKLDSLGYKRICSQIRMLLNKEQIKYISKKNSKVTVSFPETEVYITKMEYNKLKKYKDKEEILRAILGVYDQDEKTVKICIESPKEVKDSEIKEIYCDKFDSKEEKNIDIYRKIEKENKEIFQDKEKLIEISYDRKTESEKCDKFKQYFEDKTKEFKPINEIYSENDMVIENKNQEIIYKESRKIQNDCIKSDKSNFNSELEIDTDGVDKTSNSKTNNFSRINLNTMTQVEQKENTNLNQNFNQLPNNFIFQSIPNINDLNNLINATGVNGNLLLNNLSSINGMNNLHNINNPQLNLTRSQNNLLDRSNNLVLQPNIFGLPLQGIDQQKFDVPQELYNLNLLQAQNPLLRFNYLAGLNNNISNMINPLQMLYMSNLGNNQQNFNANQQALNNLVNMQNQQINNHQNEDNIFMNNNSNIVKSPKNNSIFLDKQNQNKINSVLGHNGNNSNYNSDKNENSAYNVFLK